MPHGPKDHGHKAGIDFSANTLTGQDEGASNLVWIQSRGTSFLPCKMKTFLEESGLEGSSVYIPGKPMAVDQ